VHQQLLRVVVVLEQLRGDGYKKLLRAIDQRETAKEAGI
jgi:hypothetical protein